MCIWREILSDGNLAGIANAWCRFGKRSEEPQIAQSATAISDEMVMLDNSDIIIA
jgi:hypothetical protein